MSEEITKYSWSFDSEQFYGSYKYEKEAIDDAFDDEPSMDEVFIGIQCSIFDHLKTETIGYKVSNLIVEMIYEESNDCYELEFGDSDFQSLGSLIKNWLKENYNNKFFSVKDVKLIKKERTI